MNIFRQAIELRAKKDNGSELTEEEEQLINTAIIPLDINGVFPDDLTIGEGLEALAEIMEEEMVAGSRGGAVEARRCHKPKVVGSNPTPATNYPQGGQSE